MVNEAKTEILVRKILEKHKDTFERERDGDQIIIEEKKSDNSQIDKLLKIASKRGNGCGMPEFIISFPNSDLLIVIECKGDIRKHKSKNLDKYADFSVDGALLYSSYLSKEFNVISIGASGETQQELIIDNFIQIKGEKSARDLKINKIYDFESYFGLLKKDTIKEKFDFNRLMEYSIVLNQNLRDNFEFEDNLKPLIVSGILLVLEDNGFCLAYPTKKKPLEIADLIINTIKERLDRDNIKGVKQSTIVQTYGFMKTNTQIINETDKSGKANTQLKDLIRDIEEKVRPFIQDYKQYDVIGIFYNEFLRYANGDGGLGIVLTPKHITELFVELAEVNKDSVVIDNCCELVDF